MINAVDLSEQRGKWIWKDESNTLEFISHADKNLDREKKKRKAHQEHAKQRNEKISSSAGNRSFGASRANVRATQRSPHVTGSRPTPHSTFTLEDIKNITFEMFSENNPISDSFYGLFHTDQFDNFLLHLLTYFHHYFVKLDIDAKPKDMYIERGISEVKTYADVCSRLEVAQKLLGQAYSVLVMGLGLDDMHHMTCGQSRVSSTLKDRGMYETFYSYCSLIVWINFKRKDCATVLKEIGRILRSDTFNPAIRVKNAPAPVTSDSDDKANVEEVKLTPAQYRRLHGKRPAIQSIINQRSPVIVSLIPLPEEESHDLFERKSLHERPWIKEQDRYDAIEREITHSMRNLKVGILGDQVHLYNPQNLMALSDDKDENENANQSDKLAESGLISDTSPNRNTLSPDKMSRQVTVISQATTEGFADED